MTKNRNNRLTPIGEIQDKLKRVERHPMAAVEMYVWLRENIERLEAYQRHIEDIREAKHQQEMDSILLGDRGPQNQ
jgi:hypothetical protein